MDFNNEALKIHRQSRGKIAVTSKVSIKSREDLSAVYTPGVAAPCMEIYKDEERVWEYTAKSRLVAVISDGSAVLGLGDIGPLACLTAGCDLDTAPFDFVHLTTPCPDDT